jgi:hypothetical protein
MIKINSMEKSTLWKRLKKHYILFSAGALALLLMIFLGVYQVMHSYRATPIAHIDPADSVKTTILPGKLERYKKEIIEQEKEAYRRKIALDEIVSMDFSQEIKVAHNQKLHDKKRQAELLEDTVEKREITRANLPIALLNKKHTQHKANKSFFREKKADHGFYTIKSDNKDDHLKEEKVSGNTFVKALIHGNQKVRWGDAVCLRLLEEVTLKGYSFPKNTILYGRVKGAVSGRVLMTISGLKDLRVNFTVYDGDYNEGIAYRMKEAASEIVKESRDDALNEVLSSLPYGGVAGGIAGLGRNVMRRTSRTATIYLSDGYQVFIARAR